MIIYLPTWYYNILMTTAHKTVNKYKKIIIKFNKLYVSESKREKLKKWHQSNK